MGAIKIVFQGRKYKIPDEHKIPVKTGLICPQCSRGELEIYKDNVYPLKHKNVNGESEEYEYCGGEDLFTGFHGGMVCTNNLCKKEIAFAGKYGCDDNDVVIETGEPIVYTAIKIEYIERPPRIIDTTYYGIPQNIEETLNASFKLYWIDINSCAEKIKICLEQIMDKLRVAGGNVWTNHLKERIENFSRNNEDLREVLSSSKIDWIKKTPNYDEEITEDDLRAGYDLLDFILKRKADKLRAGKVD